MSAWAQKATFSRVGAMSTLLPQADGFLSQFATSTGYGHRGDGAIFDYIAIGVLIVLGVFAVTAVSGGKFKL